MSEFSFLMWSYFDYYGSSKLWIIHDSNETKK